MSVTVETSEVFRHDTPVPVFELPRIPRADWVYQGFDVAPDSRRFLFLVWRKDESAEEATVTLLQGWRGLLE